MSRLLRSSRPIYFLSDRYLLRISHNVTIARFSHKDHTKDFDAAPPAPASPDLPPFTSALSSKKGKVDFRPGPTKTLRTSQGKQRDIEKPDLVSLNNTSIPSASKISSKQSQSPSHKPSSQDIESHPQDHTPPPFQHEDTRNPFKLAKQDIASATRHGILIPPPQGASWPKRIFHQAIELVKFYWAGLKLIFSNRRLALAIQKRVKEGGREMNRWERRFVQTCDDDVVKLVPFVLILLILEEALPFFVLYAPFLLPSTCLLASQRSRIEQQRAKKQLQLIQGSLAALGKVAAGEGKESFRLMCGILSLSKLGPDLLLRRRLQRHFRALQEDNALLISEASQNASRIPANLSHEELVEVLAERGFSTINLVPKLTAENLDWYFTQALHSAEAQSSADNLNTQLPLAARSALRSHEQIGSAPNTDEK